MLNSDALALEIGTGDDDGAAGGGEVVAVRGPNGQRIECQHVVLNGDSRLVPPPTAPSGATEGSAATTAALTAGSTRGAVSRCVCLLDGPLLAGSGREADATWPIDGSPDYSTPYLQLAAGATVPSRIL